MAYQVKNLTKVNLNATVIKVRISCRIVDKLRNLGLSHFGSTISEDKEQRVDGVGLSGSIWSYDRRERL